MTTIARGNTGRLHVTFAPIAVSTVALADVIVTITSPSLVSTNLTVVANGLNRFYADVAVNDAAELGTWTVRWDSNPPSELITVPGTYTVVAFPPTIGSRTTISQVLERIRRELNSVLRYEISTLGASCTATGTVLTLAYDFPPSLQPGAIITIGSETCRVMAVTPATRELTVIRGFYDSEAVAHATGDEVWINPRFLPTSIVEAMHDELASWPTELFRVLTYQTAIAAGADTVALPSTWATVYGLIDVRALGSTLGYVNVDAASTSFRRIEGRIVRADPSDWTAGPTTGIYFRPFDCLGTATMLFLAAAPFDLTGFEMGADLVDDCGMQSSMLDLLTIGVKLRLMPDQEIGRSQRRAQDDSRRAEEVPPEAALTPVRTLMPTYLRRRTEEIQKLRSLYPWRMG